MEAQTQHEAYRHLSDQLDLYKPTMSAFQSEHHPEAQVTFSLNNRTEVPLGEYNVLAALTSRLEVVRQGFKPEEIDYFTELKDSAGNPLFTANNIEFFRNLTLPPVFVRPKDNGDLHIESTGNWAEVSLWETVILSELNETYFAAQFEEDKQLQAALDEGDRRLTEKIQILNKRPDIKITDFGTRRRFSRAWHEHVVERLATEAPDNLVGTSNVWFARKFGLKPIGTYAHEMPMVYAGLSDQTPHGLRQSHGEFMDQWYSRYGFDLSIALTDTFGSDFFFEDFTEEQAQAWRGLRHDSGDPFVFAKQAIDFYQKRGIDPSTKQLIFSDGLDIETIVSLQDSFAEQIQIGFGWGTNLTNDLGEKALSIVMKAVNVNGIPTVKLSDNLAKAMGPTEYVDRYRQAFNQPEAHVEFEKTRY